MSRNNGLTHTKSKPTISAPVNLVTAENDLSDAPKAADAPGAINATTNAARASRTRGEPGCEKAMIKVPMQDATIATPRAKRCAGPRVRWVTATTTQIITAKHRQQQSSHVEAVERTS